MKVFSVLIFDAGIILYCLLVSRFFLDGKPLVDILPRETAYLLFLFLFPYLSIFINGVADEMASTSGAKIKLAVQIYGASLALLSIVVLVTADDLFGKKDKNDPTGGFILLLLGVLLIGLFCRFILRKAGFWKDVSDGMVHWLKQTLHLLSPFLVASFFIFFDEIAGQALRTYTASGKVTLSLIAVLIFFLAGYIPFRLIMMFRRPIRPLGIITGTAAAFFFLRHLYLMAKTPWSG